MSRRPPSATRRVLRPNETLGLMEAAAPLDRLDMPRTRPPAPCGRPRLPPDPGAREPDRGDRRRTSLPRELVLDGGGDRAHRRRRADRLPALGSRLPPADGPAGGFARRLSTLRARLPRPGAPCRPLSPAFLDLAGCTALARLPGDLALRGGRLDLRDCALIDALPERGTVAQLDIAGCGRIDRVPEGFRVTSWIDVAGSGLTALPAHLDGDRPALARRAGRSRIAFRPHELGIGEILAERNAERRRVMLERFGFEAFMAAAAAEELDADRDPGGERRLLRVTLENDEPLVCVSVGCPSTGRRYFLRVPPTMTTCPPGRGLDGGLRRPGRLRAAGRDLTPDLARPFA